MSVNIQQFNNVAEFTKAVHACIKEHGCIKVAYQFVIVHNPTIPMYTIKKEGVITADKFLKNGKLPHYSREFFGINLLQFPHVILQPIKGDQYATSHNGS